MSVNHPSFGRLDPGRVIVFDTTLRDGEQSPGFSMSLPEKLRMAEALARLGVDVIEAGFAIASNDDFAAVRAIAEAVRGPVVASLARCAERDILRAAEALRPAARPRLHLVIATSALHMRHKLQMEPEAVLDRISESVALARRHTEDVEWSAEDASRSDPDFLCRAVERAIAAGATTINLPDTVGYAMPEDIARMVQDVRARAKGADGVILSAHCHNDLGLAVANTLAAVRAGVRQIEVAVNGIGERAGNTALEEAVMAMRTRPDLYPFATGIDTPALLKTSRLLAATTGFEVQPNKAIVGRNAFAHESGIHQDGVLKNAATYEIMTPASVGWSRSNLVLGKHSGRAALRAKLAELGFGDIGENRLNIIFGQFKDLADRKKAVYEEDIVALVDETAVREHARIRLHALDVWGGTRGRARADLELEVDGEVRRADAVGDGPVDAAFNAIRTIFPHDATLVLFQVGAITEGADAQARTTVRLEEDGRLADGQGSDTDTVVSATRAYVHALNKLIVKRGRASPEAMSA